MRLFAEVAGIHQKQNAPGTAELEQTINLGDGGEGLTSARSHVHQGARFVQGQ